jgi:hypothetical protein
VSTSCGSLWFIDASGVIITEVTGERLPLYDRGKVLTQAMLMLVGGGETCADIEHLRAQADLFGSVPSDSTLYRTFRHIDPSTLAGLWEAMSKVRCAVWRRSAATTGTWHGGVGHRLVAASGPLGEQARDRELQGRLRVSPDLLLRGRDRRDPGGAAAAGQRRGQQHRRSRRRPGRGDRPAARRDRCGPSAGDDQSLVRRAVQVRVDSARAARTDSNGTRASRRPNGSTQSCGRRANPAPTSRVANASSILSAGRR